MKTMSEGLEKFAGDRLRSILAVMTKNRFMGVLTGIIVTAFNIFNTLLLIGFVHQIEAVVCYVLPMKEENNDKGLKYISGGLFSTAELSMLQARKEIVHFAERCNKAFNYLLSMHGVNDEEEFQSLFAKVEKYEGITDNMEYEIAHYLQKVSEGRLSDDAKKQVQRMFLEVDDLESIGDCCFSLARTLSRKREMCQEHFTEHQRERIHESQTTYAVVKPLGRVLEAVGSILLRDHILGITDS